MTSHSVLIYLLGHTDRFWKSIYFDNIVGGNFKLYRLLTDGIMKLLIQYSQTQNTPDADVI